VSVNPKHISTAGNFNKTQKYSRTALRYSRTTQKYSRTALRYSRATQKYSRTTQKYSRARLKYSRTTQKFSRARLMYSRTTQKFSKTTQKYFSAALRYSRTALRYSRTTQQYTSPETGFHCGRAIAAVKTGVLQDNFGSTQGLPRTPVFRNLRRRHAIELLNRLIDRFLALLVKPMISKRTPHRIDQGKNDHNC
jgi:hypothetical protein